ncbi:MAG: ParB/RepB/Spo0J family partition protein [Clostridia bacterium]|nr:ParB/RepB/Spo0J family partition protein [Clostridia bacterium]
MAQKGGLGRGLDALFSDNAESSSGVTELKLTDIEPNMDQPRKSFDEQALSELSESIAEHGLLQPILVTPKANGVYQIVAGERRWRASRLAGLDKVPVIIKTLEQRQRDEIALIENLQRQDLNALEEAAGFKSLMDNYGLTQEQVSQRLGKSRSAIANALRLLGLTDAEKEALSDGKITAGHARALLAVEQDNPKREAMFKLALLGATVRELEKMATSKDKKPKEATKKPSFYAEVELALKSELGRKVKVTPTGNGKGTITLEFYSDKELADLAKKITE